MNKNRKTAYLCAIATALIWGAAFPIVKPALAYISAQQFLLLRYALASIVLLPILVRSIVQKSFPVKKLSTIISLESISMFIVLVIYSGLERTQAIQASFIINTKPIFMTLAGIFLLREKEEKHELTGLILSVIGTAIIISSPLFFGQNFESSQASTDLGNALVFCAILIEVFYTLKIKKHYQEIDKSLIVAVSALVGTVLFGSIQFLTGNLPTWEAINHREVLLAVSYMGIMGTGVAVALNLKAYSLIEASEVVLFEYLSPLIYIPLSVWWLKDQLLPTQLVGFVIIACGVAIAETRKQKRRATVPLLAQSP